MKQLQRIIYEKSEIQELCISEYIGEEAIQKIQERCKKKHIISSNPFFDDVKIAVYINFLIDLLIEQGLIINIKIVLIEMSRIKKLNSKFMIIWILEFDLRLMKFWKKL